MGGEIASHTEHFLARQAILDREEGVYGYELLFRNGLDNFFPNVDGNIASARVIADSFLVFGIEELTGQSRAFINFSRQLLVEGRALLLPRDRVVVELLESVEPDPAVLDACSQLKKAGYQLALDDFVMRPEYAPLLALADLVKIDFRSTPPPLRAALGAVLPKRGITLVAEKVETPEEHEEGLRLGYELFQGYYFSRPVLLSRRELPASKIHYLRLLRELSDPNTEFEKLASLVQSDVALSVKLLRYINSAAVGLRHRIASIKQALMLLGRLEIRRWAGLLALTELASDKPAELLRLALTRARLCEHLAGRTGLNRRSADLFLLGLFSLLDAMLDRPFEEILAEMPLESDLSGALLGNSNRLARILHLAIAAERGEWTQLEPAAKELGLEEAELAGFYLDALRFPDELWLETEEAVPQRGVRPTGTGY